MMMKFQAMLLAFAALQAFVSSDATTPSFLRGDASQGVRQLPTLEEKIDNTEAAIELTKAEIEELNAEIAELKVQVADQKAKIKPLNQATNAQRKEWKDKGKECSKMHEDKPSGDLTEWRAEFEACKDVRDAEKVEWQEARATAKAENKILRQIVKQLRKTKKKRNNKRKRLKKQNQKKRKLKKKNAARKRKRRRKKADVVKELVAGQCVADHKCASIRGDPHITTFDGLKYDCQGDGEFVLAKTINSENTFEVQGRFTSIGRSRMVSITTAISITTGVDGEPDVDIFTELVDDECALYYYIDGVATDFNETIPGISFEDGDTDYLFFTNSGIMYSVYAKKSGRTMGCVLNSKLCLPPSMIADEDIVGLLGTPDGSKTNDWTTPSGAERDQSDTGKAAGYAYCTSDWCVQENESIFGYLPNTTWSDFYNCEAPYDPSMDAVLLDPPDECDDCCGEKYENTTVEYEECIEECVSAEEDERQDQCVIDIETAEVMADAEKKCKDPTVPDDEPEEDKSDSPDSCDHMFLDYKCSYDDNRLWKKVDYSLKQCHDECASDPECKFFSFADQGQYVGNCMGCANKEHRDPHEHFLFYPVECDAMNSPKDPDPEVECDDMRVNVKCPWQDEEGNSHEDRLYRIEDMTLETCHKKCLETDGCAYYSFGHDSAGQYANVCMGCDVDAKETKQAHIGFNLYSVGCVGDKNDVCDQTAHVCPNGKKVFKEGANCEYPECPAEEPDPEDETTEKAFTRGDPHFKTFGGELYDFHGECDLVLLHNPEFKSGLGMDVHIRTKITDWWSFVEAAAVQIGEETLEIKADDSSHHWLWINGQANDADLENNKWYQTQISGFLVRYKHSDGKKGITRQANIYLEGSKEVMILKTFRSFVRVDVNWKESENYYGSTGLLGSHAHNGARLGRDGAAIEDVNAFGQEWQVQTSEPQLFHSYEGAVLSSQKCKMPEEDATKVALRQRRLAEGMSHEEAEAACNHLRDADEREACVFDVLATQDLDLASAW